MAEPTGSTVAVVAIWLSSAVMALLGVEYYALVWGIVGAIFTMTMSRSESRKSAVISVICSALAGAALAGFMAGTVGGGRPALIACAFLAAAGAKVIVSAAIRAIEARITAAGGKSA